MQRALFSQALRAGLAPRAILLLVLLFLSPVFPAGRTKPTFLQMLIDELGLMSTSLLFLVNRVARLEALGVAEKALVIFPGDNGSDAPTGSRW